MLSALLSYTISYMISYIWFQLWYHSLNYDTIVHNFPIILWYHMFGLRYHSQYHTYDIIDMILTMISEKKYDIIIAQGSRCSTLLFGSPRAYCKLVYTWSYSDVLLHSLSIIVYQGISSYVYCVSWYIMVYSLHIQVQHIVNAARDERLQRGWETRRHSKVDNIWILATPISSIRPLIWNVTFDIEDFDIVCSFDIDVLHLQYRISISKAFDIEGLIVRYWRSPTFDFERQLVNIEVSWLRCRKKTLRYRMLISYTI